MTKFLTIPFCNELSGGMKLNNLFFDRPISIFGGRIVIFCKMFEPNTLYFERLVEKYRTFICLCKHVVFVYDRKNFAKGG